MSEKEIRATIDKLCAELDLRPGPAARVARGVFPFLLGAGLVVSACGDDETQDTTSSSSTSTSGTGGNTSTSGTGGNTSTSGTGGSGGSTSSGGGGGAGGGAAGAGGEAGGGGMQTDYMAPFPED